MDQTRDRLESFLARKQHGRPRGMTLIEIMVVLVILGLIAGAIGYNVFGQLKEAQIKTATLDLKAISNGVDLYHVETGQWPDSLQLLVPKFVREVHKDPWGNEYSYVRSGDGYDVYSYGPDKAQGGGDDITVHGGEGTQAAGK
jgi:general secretion pathway protein G